MPPVRSANIPPRYAVPPLRDSTFALSPTETSYLAAGNKNETTHLYAGDTNEKYLFVRGRQERKIFYLKFCHPTVVGPCNEVERGGVSGRTGATPPYTNKATPPKQTKPKLKKLIFFNFGLKNAIKIFIHPLY